MLKISKVTLDIGNSHPNMGIFFENGSFEHKLIDEFPIIKKHPVIVSNVGGLKKLPNLDNYFYVRNSIKEKSFIDMPTTYSDSIGDDRIVQSFYLFHRFLEQGKLIMLIDAGTFTTIDLVTNHGHNGGPIFPGVQHLINGYNEATLFTAPCAIDTDETFSICNTFSAINQGALLAITAPILKLLDFHAIDQIVVTGGKSAVYLEYFKKNGIECQLIKNLMHDALAFFHQHITMSKNQ